MIRTFIALPLPDEIKDALIQASLAMGKTIDARWVRPEAMHLTLKFLGNIEEKDVGSLCDWLNLITEKCPPFGLFLSGLGAFPSAKKARVIWAGIETDIIRMRRLASDIDSMCSEFGIQRDNRPFAAHITLARLKAPSVVNLDYNVPKLNFVSRSVNIYKSDLSPHGAEHTVLHSSPFKGGPGG